MNPAVSVVIPARNAAATISATLECLAAQTLSDWEAVLVDDGSTDATAAMAEEFALADGRLRLLRQAGAGVGAARNAAIEAARGEWLLFLDADDWIHPTALEKLLGAAVADSHAHGAVCGYARVTPDGREHDFTWTPSPDAFDELARYCTFAIHCCLVRRSSVLEVGAFDTTLRTCEDWDLWQRLARCPGRFAHVDEVLAFYRLRPGSASFDGTRMVADGLQVLTRGHGPDTRVPAPVPRLADGLPSRGLVAARLGFAAYCASLEVGAGRSPRPVFDALGDDSEPALNHHDVAGSIFEALPTGRGALPSDFADVWKELEEPVADLVAEFERRSMPGFATRVVRALEHAALDAWTGSDPLTVGRTQQVAVEVTAPIEPVLAPPGLDRLRCQVRLEGDDIGSVELPFVDGRVEAGVLADAIAAAHGWTILVRFLGCRARAPVAVDDPEGWGMLLRELWDRPDWPEPRFYEDAFQDDAAGPDVQIREGGRLAVAVHEPLPAVYAVGAAEVVLTIGSGIAATARVEARQRVSAQQLRVALTTSAGAELFRLAVRDGLLGRPIDATPLVERLRACAVPSSLDGERPEWLAAVPAGVVLGRRPADPPGTSGSRRAMLPAAVADDLLAMAQAVGEPVRVAAAGAGPVAYAPELAPPGAAGHMAGGGNGSKPATGANGSNRAEFEALFARGPDPWGYTSDYERAKYEQTLSLLPERPERVLELACAEGHFTRMLAARAGQVVAADFSRLALERARERCADLDNVSFVELDLASDELPGGFDAVFCSEVLFYLDGRDALARVGRRLARALRPGGVLISAHANAIADDPSAPGFDWGAPFGALTIGSTLARTPGLAFEVELESDPYRIQRFRRTNGPRGLIAAALSRPRRQRVDFAPMLADVAEYYRPRGAEPEAAPARGFRTVPVLMYHRVAPYGSERMRRWRLHPDELDEQLTFLRECGYRSITLDEWRAAAATRTPLPDRSVVLTFDDGYADFAEHAWPLLERHGFRALVFLVAGCVGGFNEWDAEFRDPVPLMDWDAVRSLRAEGIEFGSHTFTHPRLSALSNDEIVRELARSRTELARALGGPVSSIAYPYGDTDRVVEHLAGACGYRYGLSCAHRLAALDDQPLSLPRIEVRGGDSFAQFVENLAEGMRPGTMAARAAPARGEVLA